MTAHEPPTLREQLPVIRRWTLLIGVTVALTLLSGWALGGWNLPKMVSYVTRNFEVDDGTRERQGAPHPEWRGRRGTEICPGCRTERKVHIEGEVYTVTSASPSDVSQWITDEVAQHEHRWVQQGCWTGVSDDSMVISCLAPLMSLRISTQLWKRFLEATDPGDVSQLVAVMTHGGPQLAPLLERVEAWGEAHPVADSIEGD